MQAERTFNISTLIEEQKPGRFAVGLLFWCFLIMLMDGYDQTAVSFAAPAIIKEWHVARGGFGPVFGAGLFGTLVGSFIFGYFGDRFGRKRAIVSGSLFFGLLTLLSVWATSLHELMLLRFIAGLGMGGVVPNSVALVAEYAPKRLRATWVTLMFSGFSIGAGSGGLVSSALIHRYGWPVMFVVGGIGSLAVACLLIVTLPESAKLLVVRRRSVETVRKLVARLRPELALPADAQFVPGEVQEKKRFVLKLIFSDGLRAITPLLWIVFIVNSMALYFLQNWVPQLTANAGLPTALAFLSGTVLNLGLWVGNASVGWFADRFGLRRSIATYLTLGAIVLLSFSYLQSTAAILIGLGTVGVMQGGFLGLYAVGARIYPAINRVTGIGWAAGVGRLGAVLGPYIAGLLVARGLGMTSTFLVFALPLAIAAIAVAAMRAPELAAPARVSVARTRASEARGT